MKFPFLHVCFLCMVWKLCLVFCTDDSEKIHFTDSWAVHIENGNNELASTIAEKHEFINFGQIGSLPGYYHFLRKKVKGRRKRREIDNIATLLSEEKIKWAEQQHVLEREKRSVVPDYIQTVHSKAYSIQDPMYNDQWYLNNVGQSSGPPGLDINVLPVWARGISGKGVVVAILDDGLDHTHPDLRKNYDARASYDFNDYDGDPMPRVSDPNNCHGTKCAGEVAAEAGNNVCGVGVAFNCSIGGIRMLDGNVTDTIEGSALSFKKEFIDIYSCAWGPKDDGKRFGRPGTLASKALELGVREGRQGRGSIFVWATGNGGLTDDDCNCDGYTTSVYTISIGAISDHGLSTYYTESCASTLAVTYSGGSHREKKENKIVTTTLNHKCTDEFKGTSSAAPLASGMIALLLEANGNLTWRDVQHIIVETSFMTSPLDEGWRRNGAGKWFNQKFGFGRMDVAAMIEKAQGWSDVADLRTCWSDKSAGPWAIPSAGTILVTMNSSVCSETSSEIKTIEHVQVVLSMKHRHRGHVSIELISPSGTRTQLLKTRRNDRSNKGLKDWVFMSVHFWGEDPKGTWTLAVTDNNNNNREHHREKSRYGDFEDATEAYQDEIDLKDDKNADLEHESIVDAEDLYMSSEEFENGVFKDGSFKEKKKNTKNNDKTVDDEVKTPVKTSQSNLRKFSKNEKKKKTHSKTKKAKSKDDIDAEKIVEALIGSDQTKPDQQLLDHENSTISQNVSKDDMRTDNRTNDLPLPPKNESRNDSNDENVMLENLLKTVLSEVMKNIQSPSNVTSGFEQRLQYLEDVLFKNKSKPGNQSMSSILFDSLGSGKAIDKINNVLSVLYRSKNLTKFQNTSFIRNADVVGDVLKVLKDILSTKKDDKLTKNYKERISKLLEDTSNNTKKYRENLFKDLDTTSDSKDISPNIISDALTLIGHIIRRKKKHRTHQKIGPLSKDIQILLKGTNGKFLLPLKDLVSHDQTQITKSKTTASKEIHRNDNNVETITIEHVLHDQNKEIDKNEPTTAVDGNSRMGEYSKISPKSSYGGELKTTDDVTSSPTSSLQKTSDDSGFTIALIKNGKTIGERRVDNTQARNYLSQQKWNQNPGEVSGKTKDDGNIDVEVTYDKNTDSTAERSNTRHKIDVKPTEGLNKNIEFNVFRPHDHGTTSRHMNSDIDSEFLRNFVNEEKQEKKRKMKKKVKVKSKKSRSKGKFHDKNNSDDDVDESFDVRRAFPFLEFADPSQLPQLQLPHSDESEEFIQQLYNPFNPHGLPDFEDLPDLQEQASFYGFPNEKLQEYDNMKRSEIAPRPLESVTPTILSTETSHHDNQRSSRKRRSIISDDVTEDTFKIETADDDGPHVVKRSAIFSELYPSRKSHAEIGVNKKRSPSYFKQKQFTDSLAEKRSAIKKAFTLEGTLKKRLLSMQKESSSVLSIMKRVHDDIAVGDSKDLRKLESQLASLETKNIDSINNLSGSTKDAKSPLVRTKVSKRPAKYEIKDPDEYYKYGVDSSGELLSWTIKFYGTGP